MLLFIRALTALFLFDLYLLRGSFSAIHKKVGNCKVGGQRTPSRSIEQVCSAVDLACSWYPRQALCLQRSAALTCLLRAYGVPAQMVIGAQKFPFRAHAWVEVNGDVVNDKSYT